MRLYMTAVIKNPRHSQDICNWGEGDGQSSSVIAKLVPWETFRVMWCGHLYTDHDGIFVDRVDACLNEEIAGRTEDFIWWKGGQPSEGEWRDRGRHHSVPTKVWLLISESPRSHEIKDKSGVISKGWCVWGTLSPGFIKWYHWTWWWLLWT